MRPLTNQTKVRKEQNRQRLDAVSALQKGLATQTYDDTKLRVFSPERHMLEGESLFGKLKMVKEYEEFEFVAQAKETYTRNPTVFEGEYLNVHLDKFGALVVSLRRTELHNRKQAVRDGEAIKTELLTAAKVLGL